MRFTLIGFAAFATLLTSFALLIFQSKYWKRERSAVKLYTVVYLGAVSAVFISLLVKYREAIRRRHVAQPASCLLKHMGELLGVFVGSVLGKSFEKQDVVYELWTTFFLGVASVCLLEIIWPSTDLGVCSIATQTLVMKSLALSDDQHELLKNFGVFAGIMLSGMKYYLESKRLNAQEEPQPSARPRINA